MNLTVQKSTGELKNVTDICVRPGTGSKGMQANRCLAVVLQCIGAEQLRQVGSLVGILQWLKGLSRAGFVSIGPLAVVDGLSIFGFVTVALSTCTSYPQHVTAVCGTVAMARLVRRLFLISIT